MKKHAAKACLICFEIVAIILAVTAAGGVYLYWQLERGPVSLTMLKPSIEHTISHRFPEGFDASIERVEIMRQVDGALAISLVALDVRDAENRKVAGAKAIVTDFSIGIFSGAFGARNIEAHNAEFLIVRNERQRVKIPVAQRRTRKSPMNILAPAFDGRLLKSAFESAEIENAIVRFYDEPSGRTWITQNAGVSLNRTNSGLVASVSGDVDADGAPAGLKANAQYTENSGVISVEMDGTNFPIGDILTTLYGDRAAFIDAPVSGNAVISFTTQGEVLSSQFIANVDQGTLTVANKPLEISTINWQTTFNPSENQFEIEQLSFEVGGNKGVVEGSVSIAYADSVQEPDSISFALTGRDLVADIPEILPKTVPVSEARVVGAYRFSDRRLALHSIDISLLDILIGANVTLAFPQAESAVSPLSPEVRVNLAVDGDLDPHRLLRIWPLGVAMGARDWIEDRIETAVISNIEAVVDLPAGAVGADGLIPDETMSVTFDVGEAKAFFVKEMTPITNGSGRGVLRGNSFMLFVDQARVGDITIPTGEVEFPEFIPKWQPTYIRFSADGRSESMLGLLDQAPLSLLSKINLQPNQFVGDASAEIEIMRPNKRHVPADEFRYSGNATFEHMEISDLLGGADLSGANGNVELKARSMIVTAKAQLSDAPMSVEWEQKFFDEDGPSSFKVAGTIDSSTGDLFGIPSRQYLRGPVAFNVNASGDLGAFDTVDISADFSNAALTVDTLGWRKPMGEPVKGKVRFDISADAFAINNLSLEGETISIAGNLRFSDSGALEYAHMPRIFMTDAADISITARRNASNELVVNSVGEYFNAGPLIETFIVGGSNKGETNDNGFDWGPGLSLTARIDRISMRDDVEYKVASLDLWRDSDGLQALDFAAFDRDGPPLTVNLSLTGEETGPTRAIIAQSGAIGRLLQGVFGLTSVTGGEGSMLVNLKAPGDNGIHGQIEARNLTVVGTPLLARIFSAGSLVGLANLLSNEGIGLSYAYGEFDFADGVLSIDDMRATGPSVGITADGTAAMSEGGKINLNGAIAPVYQLNSILGNAPIIGDIFVGKKGEGILALSYSVTGERIAPSVLVNPLSALTPGIFRRLFEPQQTIEESITNETPSISLEAGEQE